MLTPFEEFFPPVAAHGFQRHTSYTPIFFFCEPGETLLDKTIVGEFLKSHFEQQTFSYPRHNP